MKQLSGYVLVQGSNVGVPNLVVSAYDTRDFLQSATAERTMAEVMQQLGRRLGSVLTDAAGRFVMGGDDLRFDGNEARPNVVLTVSAPEDVKSAEKPAPLPPESRLLYISSVARRDAGAEEAFVIRLLPAQMQKFGITAAPSAGQTTTAASRMADTLQAGYDASDLVRERFQSRLKIQVTDAQKRHQTAKARTGTLSGIPAHLRGADNPLHNNKLLIPDRNSLTQLPDLQKTALKEGLSKLKDRKPVIRLYLTPAEIEDMKLELSSKGHVSGHASAKTVMAKVRNSMQGSSLIRARGFSMVSAEELQRKYLQTPLGSVKAAPANAQTAVTLAAPAPAQRTASAKARSAAASQRRVRKTNTKKK